MTLQLDARTASVSADGVSLGGNTACAGPPLLPPTEKQIFVELDKRRMIDFCFMQRPGGNLLLRLLFVGAKVYLGVVFILLLIFLISSLQPPPIEIVSDCGGG